MLLTHSAVTPTDKHESTFAALLTNALSPLEVLESNWVCGWMCSEKYHFDHFAVNFLTFRGGSQKKLGVYDLFDHLMINMSSLGQQKVLGTEEKHLQDEHLATDQRSVIYKRASSRGNIRTFFQELCRQIIKQFQNSVAVSVKL